MNKKTMILFALAAMTTNFAIHAETQDAAAAQTESAVAKLSADELSFAAKLSDQNRKSFTEKLSSEQRKAVQIAVKHGANADEAVQKMVAATAIKDNSAIAHVASENPASAEK